MVGLSKKEKLNKYLQCITVKKNKTLLEVFLTSMLFVFSVVYKLILIIRLYFYQWGFFSVYKSGLKVISVGNITVGGTGKTPLVALIAEFLLKRKQKVTIISSGYKSMDSELGLVADEPLMLTKQLPEANIIISKNRKQAIITLKKNSDDSVVILDDAFQNCAIEKKMDIVCVNCLNPFGNGYIIPRGIMRLPFSYLKRADIFILTHCSNPDSDISNTLDVLRKHNRNALICKSKHVPEFFYDFYSNEQQSLNSIRDKKIAIICGISHPDNFNNMLESLGAEISLKFYFPDHYNFRLEQIKDILSDCMSTGISLLVTTAKDEPRLKLVLKQDEFARFNLKILVLKIRIILEENEEGFAARLSSIFTT
ncbi:MAG: tetraacyldisaccharide 4'-kinase [Candidatus Omnitrophica bacterium]|nr:tetraacyldisaccharide 4'-kinase [Candidatus Omnitrophota bacterium]